MTFPVNPEQKLDYRKIGRPPRSQKIPNKERLITAAICAQLGLAIWTMALTGIWSQITFATLAVFGFGIALAPERNKVEAHSTVRRAHRGQSSGQGNRGSSECGSKLSAQTSRGSKSNLSKLVRFPLFWSGLLLLIYIAIQGLNPAYGYETVGTSWRAFPVEHISWLPNSVAGPFAKINPWRLMLYLGAAWLFLNTFWIGIGKRRAMAFILWFLFINSIAFCILVVAQKQFGAEGIYWNPEWNPFPNFFGTVPYKNRGATLLYLMMGCSMALYFYEARIKRERMLKSGPHLLVILGVLLQYGTLWSSYSRGGLAVSTAMIAIFFFLVFFTSFPEENAPILKLLPIPLILIIAFFGYKALPRMPDFERTLARFSEIERDVEERGYNGREIPSKITWDMFQAKKWYGWGAGSWRYIFAYQQMNYPEIANEPDARYLKIWDDAHNDWFQYLSELGMVGTPFLLFFIAYPMGFLLFRIARARCTHLILLATLCGVFLHAFIELLFQNMAILALTATVIVLLLKLPFNRRLE